MIIVSLKKNKLFFGFLRDLKYYKELDRGRHFSLTPEKLKPCLFDRTTETPIDYVYFYQDAWCAKKIFKNKPGRHYDIGSKLELIGIISQFTPTTTIDIRPANLELENFSFAQGDVLRLPFEDDSLLSISSICVIEHIGLGRYGDALDPLGSEKAIAEIKRVLKANGDLYVSLPIYPENIICFNAHRAFRRDYILKLFQPLKLIEEKYIYKNRMFDNYDEAKGFGTGLFYFKKQ